MISATTRQPLKDIVIGLSLSEHAPDMSLRGLPPDEANRLVLRFAEKFLSHGATLAFGHDWRPDGVMEAVYDLAVRYTSLAEESAPTARLRNIVPWPARPALSRNEQESLRPILEIETGSLPPGLSETPPAGISETEWKHYLKSRALTWARRRLNDLSHVRVCAGGRTSGSAGRYLGIVEEAWLALKSSKPLFLAGVLGGASQHLINAVISREFDESLLRPLPDMVALYAKCRPLVPDDGDDSQLDPDALLQDFKACSADEFAARCGLTAAELPRLGESWDITEALDLVLKGCLKLYES
jgi:SLOG cluster2